ncbi:MAG: putative Ig domain-containing protein [Bacteroidales bacterium]|nr:putative Ig domain-containing protein [Bacteroidales bacterium]
MGNSITYGQDTRGLSDAECIGYRYQLYQLLNSAGYTFDFVGSNQAGWNYLPSSVTDSLNYTDNAGFPGAHTYNISSILRTGKGDPNDINACQINYCPGRYLNQFNPDAILLHLGTNDISVGNPITQMRDTMNAILNIIDNYEQYSGKNVPVFLAKIILRENLPANSTANQTTQQYNQLLTELKTSRPTDNIIIVDMESGAGLNYDNVSFGGDMYDTWHPATSGYNKMGAEWFEALENYNFRAPVVGNIPDQFIGENQTSINVDIKPYVFDPQEKDENITWSYQPYPSAHFNITFSNGFATISRKNAGWSGNETLTFKAQDSGNGGVVLYDTDEVTITSEAPNVAPVLLERNPFYINEDTPLDLSLDSFQVDDPNNVYPDDFTLHVQPGSNYTVLTGNIVVPANNYHGSLTVPVYVNDGMENSNVRNMSVAVNPVNDRPWMTLPNPKEIAEDSFMDKMVIAGDNDTEDQLTLSVVGTLPSWLTFVPATGRLSGTPLNSHVGNNSFTLRVSDGKVNVDSVFTIRVTNTNDLPEFTSFPNDTLVSVNHLFEYYFAATDFDPTGDPLTYAVPFKPEWITYDGQYRKLSGSPEIGDLGNHYVSISVFDGKGYTYQNFTLIVKDINYPPVITSIPSETVNENDNFIYAIKATDIENDTLHFSSVKKPDWLTFYESGVFMGKPSNEHVGDHEVIYSVHDGINEVYDTFNLTVVNVNDRPEIIGPAFPLYTPKDVPLTFRLNMLSVNDIDNVYPDDFNLKLLAGSDYTVIDSIVVPFSGYTGVLNVALQVNDGLLDSDTKNIPVSVGVSGLDEDNTKRLLHFPNPVKEELTIVLENQGLPGTLLIYDSSLRMVKEFPVSSGENLLKIYVGDLTNGFYFYRLSDTKNSYSGKFIKVQHF